MNKRVMRTISVLMLVMFAFVVMTPMSAFAGDKAKAASAACEKACKGTDKGSCDKKCTEKCTVKDGKCDPKDCAHKCSADKSKKCTPAEKAKCCPKKG